MSCKKNIYPSFKDMLWFSYYGLRNDISKNFYCQMIFGVMET